MWPLRRGGYLRALLARARGTELSIAPRRASGGLSGARDSPAEAGWLRGEVDRFGGVSVRLGALDRLDASAFQRGLHGKCLDRGSRAPRLPSKSPGPTRLRLSGTEPGGRA